MKTAYAQNDIWAHLITSVIFFTLVYSFLCHNMLLCCQRSGVIVTTVREVRGAV